MKSIKDATHFISRECFSVIGLMRAFALYRINNTLCEKYSCDGTHFAKLSHSETLIRYELIELAAQNVTVFYSAYKCNRKSRMVEGKVVKLHFPPRRLNKGGDWPNFIHSDVLAESLSSLIDNKMPPKSIYPIRFERDGLQLEHHSLCLLVGESLFMIAGGNCEKGSSLYRDQLKHLDQLEVPAAISKKSVPAIVGMKYGYLPSYPVNSNTTCDTITVDISDPNCYKAKLLSSEKYDLHTGQSFENWIQTLSEL